MYAQKTRHALFLSVMRPQCIGVCDFMMYVLQLHVGFLAPYGKDLVCFVDKCQSVPRRLSSFYNNICRPVR